MKPVDALSRLGGAHPELIRASKGYLTQYVVVGSAVIAVSLMAAISAFFELRTTIVLADAIGALLSALLGVLVFCVLRALVMTMRRRGSGLLTVVSALPRLALSAVIGFAVALPLVLHLFDAEIEAERRQSVVLDVLTPTPNERVSILAAEEQELAQILASTQEALIGADPNVRRLQQELAALDRQIVEVQSRLICEIEGTCGSGEAGRGPLSRASEGRLGDLRADRDRVQNELDAATTVSEATLQRRERVQDRLGEVRSQLARARVDLESRISNVTGLADPRGAGILARLDSLTRLGNQEPVAALAIWLAVSLFTVLTLVPVGLKLAFDLGPTSLHERLVSAQEAEILERQRIQQEADRTIEEARAQARIEAAANRIGLQLENESWLTPAAERNSGDPSGAVDSEIGRDSIHRWSPLLSLAAGAASVASGIIGWLLSSDANGGLYGVPVLLGVVAIALGSFIASLRRRYIARMHRRLDVFRIETANRDLRDEELSILADDSETLRRTGDVELSASYTALISAARE